MNTQYTLISISKILYFLLIIGWFLIPMTRGSFATAEVLHGSVIGMGSWDTSLPESTIPQLIFNFSTDKRNAEFTVTGIADFSRIDYVLTYSNDNGLEGAVGGQNLADEDTYERSIYLGTCSTGYSCTPDRHVSGAGLKVTLTKPDASASVLEASL